MSVSPEYPTQQPAPAPEPCAACAAPLASDQRYCLQCGELRHGARRPLPALLRGSIDDRDGAAATSEPASNERWPSLAAALAGIACLLIAMGVGVLIGRGGGNAAAPAPITIAQGPATTAATSASTAFPSDWPTGKDGWTIALSVLPKSSTQPGAVAAAKTAATGKGAARVGALDSDAHPALTAGSYVVYSGVYDDEKAATAALARLKARFADARVVHVAAPGSSRASHAPRAGAKDRGASPSKPKSSSASRAQDTKKAFEETKKAPKTVGTGGKAPPEDHKPAAGGGDFQDIG